MADWVALELSSRADGESPDLIRASIRHHIRDAVVFLPASTTQVGEDRVTTWLLDGYAFVRHDFPEERYARLVDTKYVDRPVRGPGGRLATVADADIDKFRQQIVAIEDQGIRRGDQVDITSGAYRNLKAEVIDVRGDAVQVFVRLRSKESLVTLPRTFVRLFARAAAPSLGDRLEASLREWVQVRPIFWEGDPGTLHRAWERYQRVSRWVGALGVYALKDLDGASLRAAHHKYTRLQGWAEKGRELTALYAPLVRVLPVADVEQVYLRWAWLNERVRAVTALHREIAALESTMHVYIDGHNLACRCATAPGLDKLTDSQGRPTGAILGFLNSLAAWKKVWPEGRFVVVWDGSSQRRKALFPGYKASRGSLGVYREVTWLQEHLPSFGVMQAMHPEEEADDVIATLVARNPGASVVVSTDRDLLQLVSPTVSVFSPVSNTLFTPEKVKETYGVSPEQMPHYRAFSGDASDEIPGVPGCGPKTAAHLVSLYGSVDGVYRSSLAGLSKTVYNSLKAAQADVRRNLVLNTLVRDLVPQVRDPQADRTKAQAALDESQIKSDRIVPAFFQLALF